GRARRRLARPRRDRELAARDRADARPRGAAAHRGDRRRGARGAGAERRGRRARARPCPLGDRRGATRHARPGGALPRRPGARLGRPGAQQPAEERDQPRRDPARRRARLGGRRPPGGCRAARTDRRRAPGGDRMTVRTVHRPTRETLPLTRPEPEAIAPPPPLAEDAGVVPLQMLLPILGASTSVVMMVVMRNSQPLFLAVAGLVFVVAIIGGVGFALSARGRNARQQAAKRELYLDYLERTRGDLERRTHEVRLEASVLHPQPDALMSLIRDPKRLWERRRRDTDFLDVRAGPGVVPWFQVDVPAPESPVQPHDPILLSEAELVAAAASRVESMPMTVPLRQSGVVAVIGDRDRGVALIRSMLLQIAALHAPDDVGIAL